MAQKNIDPFAKRKKDLPPELLERVTKPTGPPAVKPQTPPPRKPLPAGISGNPPLPVGRAVSGISPSSLTPGERASLEAVGWTDDVPIPSNMAQILADEQTRRLAEEVPMPVDPNTPPLKVTTVDISSLPNADQKRLMETVKSAFTAEVAAKEAQASAASASAITTPGLADAMQAANKATAAFRGDSIEDDRTASPAPAPAPAQVPAPPPAPAAPHAHEESPTGANVSLTNCPHCQWPLDQPDVPEPPHADKMAFLHCLIGQKTFVKTYPLFGGNVEVTFRTLTPREIDIVYRQAFADRELGKINTEVDYWERVNRYRLLLQLLKYAASGEKGFIHDLHDGYSKEANPDADSVWVTAERAQELKPNETAIPVIEDYMIENVLKTEAVFRAINNACNQFNRVVAKMEAMADNSDFWKPTEAQH